MKMERPDHDALADALRRRVLEGPEGIPRSWSGRFVTLLSENV
jgi:hypothetical protein